MRMKDRSGPGMATVASGRAWASPGAAACASHKKKGLQTDMATKRRVVRQKRGFMGWAFEASSVLAEELAAWRKAGTAVALVHGSCVGQDNSSSGSFQALSRAYRLYPISAGRTWD